MPKLTGVPGDRRETARRLGGRQGDRGAVASLVAVLLAGGVLLGMGALVVDVGLLYVEREELQSGADAASVAVAESCVEHVGECTPTLVEPLADRYAGGNARDGLAEASVCGRVPAPGALPACPSDPTNLTKCLGDPPVDPRPYVEVRTSTLVDGGTALPPVFAGAVASTGGATVAACSRVSWGPVRAASTELGIAICEDQFDAATRSGGVRVFQPAPVGGDHDPTVDPGREIVLRWRSGADPDTSCGGVPDGFRWIAGSGSGSCPHSLDVGTLVPGTTAEETPAGCGGVLRGLVANPRPVPVAIYAEGDDPGEAVTIGIAMFVPTGWRYSSAGGWGGGPLPVTQQSTLSSAHLCAKEPDTFCLYGYFTIEVVRDPGPPAPLGDHFGAVFLRTIG